jgi:hypothetical protein
MYYTVERIAQVVHEAQRALQTVQGEPVPAPEWNYAPEYMKSALIKSIRLVLQGATPEQTHELWLSDKIEDGWTFGKVKDSYARKHPCMLPYEDLPQTQRDKNDLLVAIVSAFAAGIATTELDRRNVVWLEDARGKKAVAQIMFQEPDYKRFKKAKVNLDSARKMR